MPRKEIYCLRSECKEGMTMKAIPTTCNIDNTEATQNALISNHRRNNVQFDTDDKLRRNIKRLEELIVSNNGRLEKRMHFIDERMRSIENALREPQFKFSM